MVGRQGAERGLVPFTFTVVRVNGRGRDDARCRPPVDAARGGGGAAGRRQTGDGGVL